ncbi:GL25110 [Drosophila persimilis]|uniref:GL25110 n=1 Tax=Drosophila persimilis TaxID=7234 RepID=B4GQW9_DROPE|nr:GL25110 [Drosophila persimilis]
MCNTVLCVVAAASAQLSSVCLYEPDGTRVPVATHCGRFAVCQQGEVVAIGSCPRGLHFNRQLAECDFQWRANCLGLSPFAGTNTRADAECTCTCCADECPDIDDDKPGLTTSVTEPCDTDTEPSSSEPAVTSSTNPTEPDKSTDGVSDETTTDELTTDTNNVVNTTPSPPSAVPTYCSSQRDECANQTTNVNLPIPGVCERTLIAHHRVIADSSEDIEGPSGTTCTSQGVCAGMRDGTLIADPETNGYFVCQCQCPIAMPCDEYTKFNQTAQVCDWDTSAESTAVICPDGLVYNATANECDYPEGYVPEVACNSTSNVCQGEEEGALFPVDGVCNKFYKCNYNCAVEQQCPNNLIFNVETEICDYPQNVQCQWPHTPPSGPNAGPSGIACETNGRCLNAREGYLECENGIFVIKKCPDQYYFNTTLNKCVEDTSGVCVGCVEGSTKADSDGDCTKYEVCSSGKYVSKSCGTGDYWNALKGECEKDNGECNGNSTCTEGQQEVNPADCAGYLECIHGSLVARKCPDLNYFNVTENKCVLDTEGVCISKVCDPECCDKSNNWIGPVDKNCSAFIQCVYGIKFEQRCPNNLQFNPSTLDCDFPENVKCDDGSAPPSGPNAGPSGTYCESHGRCVGQPDGTMFGDASTTYSSAYVVCQCECEVDFNCNAGLLYNPQLKVCDWPENVKF